METPYIKDKLLGQGGMGSVWLAHDSFGRRCALKVLDNKFVSQKEYRDLIMREAKAIGGMDHPSVVHLLENPYVDTDGNICMPMELIEGQTLDQTYQTRTRALVNDKPFTNAEVVDVMVKILEAFEYIHSHGCIHRDVKPSNIMLRPDGTVCVVDFGIAKDSKLSTGMTVGIVLGTDGYMSPEQANGLNVDHRTDIYSLGCLMFFLLTGHDAITAKENAYDTRKTILAGDRPKAHDYNPNVNKDLEDIIEKAMNRNMTFRFSDVGEFRQALQRADLNTLTGAIEMPKGKYITISVGRALDNRLHFNNSLVSSHHLELRYFADCNKMAIVDHSRNGTGVGGRKLHHRFMIINYPPSNGEELPECYLAGIPELAINWQHVKKQLELILGHSLKPSPSLKPYMFAILLMLIAAVVVVAVLLFN